LLGIKSSAEETKLRSERSASEGRKGIQIKIGGRKGARLQSYSLEVGRSG